MEISIRELLKTRIPSNELKQRFTNKQIKLNNGVVTDLNQVLSIEPDFSIDFGEFCFFKYEDIKYLSHFSNVRDWFGDYDTNVSKYKFLGAYHLLEFSKRDSIVLLIKPSMTYSVDKIDEETEVEIINELGTTDFMLVPEELFHYMSESNFWNKQ